MMKQIDRPEWIKHIERAAGGKAVLLVEGSSDIRIFSYFLDRISSDWHTRFGFFSGGSKNHIMQAIKTYHPEWGGIVDLDEWSPEYVSQKVQSVPRIRILPRFCLENYFCVPEELWDAVPPQFKTPLVHGQETLRQPLVCALPDWLAHGAIWRVIRRKHTRLVYDSRFPTEFDSQPITDEQEIRRILETWHTQLDPEQILREYRVELSTANKRTVCEQLTGYVHGKKFFQQVVTKTMNALFGQANPEIWLERFTQEPYGLSVPSDLFQFLQEVLALFETEKPRE